MEHMVSEPATYRLVVSDLSQSKPTPFEIIGDADLMAEIAKALDVPAIKKLRFSGSIGAHGASDWRLQAELGATVTQECVVTLDPVNTRIDETVIREYFAELPEVEGTEVEMPENDNVELTPRVIDLKALMIEALSLALPAFPRKDGVDLGEAVFTEPGKAAMTDEDARPFAALGGLREALGNKGSEGAD